MRDLCHTAELKTSPHILEDPLAVEITREIEADHERELKKLSDHAFMFLTAVDGDPAEAEELLNNFIDLLFEAGALSTWRYRLVLAKIRGEAA
jgi:hypothetical protein